MANLWLPIGLDLAEAFSGGTNGKNKKNPQVRPADPSLIAAFWDRFEGKDPAGGVWEPSVNLGTAEMTSGYKPDGLFFTVDSSDQSLNRSNRVNLLPTREATFLTYGSFNNGDNNFILTLYRTNTDRFQFKIRDSNGNYRLFNDINNAGNGTSFSSVKNPDDVPTWTMLTFYDGNAHAYQCNQFGNNVEFIGTRSGAGPDELGPSYYWLVGGQDPGASSTHPQQKTIYQAYALGRRMYPAEFGELVARGVASQLLKPANDAPFLISVPDEGGATLTAEAGTYTFTGADAALTHNKKLSAEAGAFTFTGADAALSVGKTLTAETGTFTFTGSDAALRIARAFAAEAASYTFTGADAGLSYSASYSLTAEAGSYTFNGADAALTISRSITAETGTYTFTGADVGLTYNPVGAYSITAESGSYTFTGADAGLTVSRSITAEAGSFAYTGADAAFSYTRTLTAEAGSFTFTGANVAFGRTYALSAELATYAFTGAAATLSYSEDDGWTPIDSATTIWTEI